MISPGFRFLGRIVTLATLAATVAVGAPHPSAAQSPADVTVSNASTGTVTWEPEFNLVGRNLRSTFPWAAMDSNNHVHVAYRAGASDAGAIVYRNNINGGFSTPIEIAEISKDDTSPYMALAVAPDNSVWIAFALLGRDTNIYYRKGTPNPNGSYTWGPRVNVSGNRGFNTHMVVDKEGNAHITWLDGDDPKTIRYRRVAADGTLGRIERPRDDSNFQKSPQVAVTDDGRVHFIFQRGTGRGADIWYSRRELNGSYSSQNLTNSGGAASLNPSISSDGTRLFVAWDEVTDSNHDLRYTVSEDGGRNWRGSITFSGGPSFASYPSVRFAPGTGRVYVAWTDTTGGSDGDIWMREYNPITRVTSGATRINNNARSSDWPVVAVGSTRGIVVWHDQTPGERATFASTGRVTDNSGAYGGGAPPPPPPTCTGTVTLENGAASTNKTTITVAITPNADCAPNPPLRMKVRVGGAPEATTPEQAFAPTFTVDVADPGSCTATVVGVQLIDNNGAGAAFSSSILVDQRATDLKATLTNPRTGDPQYTNLNQASLSVTGAADCSGLQSVTFNGATYPARNNKVERLVELVPAGLTNPGPVQAPVTLTDGVGNPQTFNGTVFFDPTPPNASGGQITDSGAASLIRTLTVSGVAVQDNAYGATPNYGPELGAGNQFWGVRIAASLTDNLDQNANALNALNWTAYAVPTANRTVAAGSPTATTSFNLAYQALACNALAQVGTPTETNPYYIYVQFIDGAGNPSATTYKVTLAATAVIRPNCSFYPLIFR